ncbi:hypothetical protein BV20DRAFT_983077 [Pilatotrama ljubarskyi]|nr:hypothetical protein BV20DRAFT_983077 [Pilatotrama ljubarskyi]
MFALSFLTLGLTAASAMALPTAKLPRADSVGPWCDGLGAGAFDTWSGLTLAALNTTGANTNSTGVPLVLATGGFFNNIEMRRFATWASFGANDYSSFSLANGTIILNGGPKPAQAIEVQDASELNFITKSTSDPADPLAGAQIYCGVAKTDPAGSVTGYPTLAVNGDASSFSICREGTQEVVIYKAAADRNEACYPVELQLIPAGNSVGGASGAPASTARDELVDLLNTNLRTHAASSTKKTPATRQWNGCSENLKEENFTSAGRRDGSSACDGFAQTNKAALELGPLLLVHYQDFGVALDNPTRNLQRMACVSAAHFLSIFGVTGFAMYGLSVCGPYGIITMAWYSSCLYVVDRNTAERRFDLTEPSGVLRYMGFLSKLEEHARELRLLERAQTEEGLGPLRWTALEQLKESVSVRRAGRACLVARTLRFRVDD